MKYSAFYLSFFSFNAFDVSRYRSSKVSMTFFQLHSAVSIVLVLIQNSGVAEVACFVYFCISWKNHLVFPKMYYLLLLKTRRINSPNTGPRGSKTSCFHLRCTWTAWFLKHMYITRIVTINTQECNKKIPAFPRVTQNPQ
jgi:hypothetical protein